MKIISTIIFVGSKVPANVLVDVFNAVRRGNLGDVVIAKMEDMPSNNMEQPVAITDALKPTAANGKGSQN